MEEEDTRCISVARAYVVAGALVAFIGKLGWVEYNIAVLLFGKVPAKDDFVREQE